MEKTETGRKGGKIEFDGIRKWRENEVDPLGKGRSAKDIEMLLTML